MGKFYDRFEETFYVTLNNFKTFQGNFEEILWKFWRKSEKLSENLEEVTNKEFLIKLRIWKILHIFWENFENFKVINFVRIYKGF